MSRVHSWDRANKNLVREEKLSFIADYIEHGYINRAARLLSLPGPEARLEKSLFLRGLVSDVDMVAVEADQKFADKLTETRNTHLPEMGIYPGTLAAFAEEELDLGPFDIVDADFCGTFSERLDGTVIKMMNNGQFSDRALLLVNQSKGHDVIGKTREIISVYFSSAKDKKGNLYIDLEKMNFFRELSSENEKKAWWQAVRYYLIPAYYVCQAFDTGYNLTVEKLFEYRDSYNPMLQWVFYLQEHQQGYNNNLRMMREELSRIKKRGYDKYDLQRDR